MTNLIYGGRLVTGLLFSDNQLNSAGFLVVLSFFLRSVPAFSLC